MDYTPIPVVTFDEAKRLDEFSISYCNCTPFSLMQKAAASLWQRFISHINEESSFQIDLTSHLIFLAGNSNNGGDSIGMAINAYQSGYKNTTVVIVSKEGSDSYNQMYANLIRLPIRVLTIEEALKEENKDLLKSDFLFDGICGIGVEDKPLRACWVLLLDAILIYNPIVVAIDVPSGLQTLLAHITLSVELPKVPFYSLKKRALCGTILWAPIPFPLKAYENIIHNRKDMLFLGKKITNDLTAINDPEYFKSKSYLFHKYKRGVVTLFVGSKFYAGAALLSALGASATGAGYIKVFTHRFVFSILLQALPGAVCNSIKGNIKKSIKQEKGYLVVGSGWGTSSFFANRLKTIINGQKDFLVIDASAIKIIANNIKIFYPLIFRYQGSILLTPHRGEFDFLYQSFFSYLKKKKKESLLEPVNAPFYKKVLALSKVFNCEILAKDAISHYCYKKQDCYQLLFFDGLNSALAVAGSGDILASFIIGLVAKINSYKKATFYDAVPIALALQDYAANKCYKEIGFFQAHELILALKKATSFVFPKIECGGIYGKSK